MDYSNTQNFSIREGGANKEKKISKLKSLKFFLQKKHTKLALVLALLGAGAPVAYTALKDINKDKIEQTEDKIGYPFTKHHLDFWDNNPTFFTKNLVLKKEKIAHGVEIIRDAGLTFYVVQKEDLKEKKETIQVWENKKIKKGKKTTTKKVKVSKVITRKEGDFDKIRTKLSKMPEFAYLTEDVYAKKIESFNIFKEDVKSGMHLPIPLNHNVREISPQDFANYCHAAIQEMQQDKTYSEAIQELLSYTTEKELITDMIAFGRSETTAEYTKFIKPLGEVELHRREPVYKSFSLSYFHILMEKNADGKTPGPGLKARLKLGLTEGQCYHPKNAAKLFLAYWIEKNHGNLKNIFPITNNNIEKVATIYNGNLKYADKLKPNFEYAKKLMNGDIINFENTNLEKSGFHYNGLNAKYEHVYKFITPPGIRNNDELKQFVVEQFNKNKADDCPAIDENAVVTQGGKKLSENIIPDTICVCVPH